MKECKIYVGQLCNDLREFAPQIIANKKKGEEEFIYWNSVCVYVEEDDTVESIMKKYYNGLSYVDFVTKKQRGIILQPRDIDWGKVRVDAAIAAMNGMMYRNVSPELVAKESVEGADCLIDELTGRVRKLSIDERMKRIMQKKREYGEFSVDLYYNDVDQENPYTAKVNFFLEDKANHYRGKSFDEVITEVERFFE